MDLLTLRYLARRVTSMGSRELFHRVRLKVWQHAGRIRFRTDPGAMSWARVWADRGHWLHVNRSSRPADTVTRELLAALPRGWWQAQSFWDSFSRKYPSERADLLDMAEEAVAGKIRLFQWKTVELTEPIQWSQTLEPGRPGEVWPSAYFADIDVLHDPSRQDRDVRWCWEINRFQYLLWLGAAWRLTGLEKFACVAREYVDSWLASVSYPAGVQWQSNLEVGLRALSWARCHILCSNSESWDANFTERFLAGLYVHAHHLHRELGVHLPLGNHLLGETAALHNIATLYPSFAEAAEWKSQSLAIINRIVPRLILSDGTYAEQATGYVRFVLEFLLSVLHLSPEGERCLSHVATERLVRAIARARHLSEAFGEMPMVGDSDTGLAIGWQLSDFWDFSPLCASAAVLLDKPDLAGHLEKMPAEAFLLVGDRKSEAHPPAGEAFASGHSRAVSPASVDFPAGGFSVSRDERLAVGLDTSPLGLGPGFCHGHADALSLILAFDGKPALVDPGTGLYNGSPLWRGYFRSTGAHNTVRMDRDDPTQPLNTFRWSAPVDVRREPPRHGEGWCAMTGRVRWREHAHHRMVLHLLNRGIIVFDRITGQGRHDVEWRLHLDPNWDVKQSREHVVTAMRDGSELEILWLSPHDTALEILRGSKEPMAGWYSRYYGSILPTTTVAASFSGRLPWRAITILRPSGTPIDVPEGLALPAFAPNFADLICSEEFAAFTRAVPNR